MKIIQRQLVMVCRGGYLSVMFILFLVTLFYKVDRPKIQDVSYEDVTSFEVPVKYVYVCPAKVVR